METLRGNTITLKDQEKKRIVPSKRWCFTAFDEMEILETKIKAFDEIKFIFGRETCPTTNRAHCQGYIECINKIRPVEMFSTKTTHWEKAKGNEEANVAYCSKEGNFETNIRIKKDIIDPLAGLDLFPWQQTCMDIIDEPVDNRKIYWFWEGSGCTGKSSLAKHICMKYNALLVGGKGNDIKYAVSSYLETKELDVLIYDVPRSVGNIVSYSSIEEIKNGCMFSTKYESGMKIFNPPHIIIFCNFAPLLENLSLDRWVVINI